MSKTNVTAMAIGANLSTTISTVLSFFYLYNYYKKSRKDIWQDVNLSVKYKQDKPKVIIKKIIAVSMPMSLSSILSSISKNIDSITVVRGLKTFLTEGAAKIQYGILTGKVDTLTTLPLSFNIAFATALVPALAGALAVGDEKAATRRVSFSLLITMLIGLPCTAGLCVLAEPILQLLFPNAPGGGTLLAISSLAIIFTVLSQTINGALQGIGKVLVPAIALGIGVGVKFILNIILVPIPWIGANGAAVGSVVCNIISFAIGYYVLNKNMRLDLKFSKFIIKPIIATLMMSVCTLSTYFIFSGIILEILATIISLIISVIIYVILIFILRIFTKEDIMMLPNGEKLYKVLIKCKIYKTQ